MTLAAAPTAQGAGRRAGRAAQVSWLEQRGQAKGEEARSHDSDYCYVTTEDRPELPTTSHGTVRNNFWPGLFCQEIAECGVR